MKYRLIYRVTLLLTVLFLSYNAIGNEKFPDGTPIPEWFRENEIVDINTLGKHYRITDHGVKNDSTVLQTKKIQTVIDKASANGGGVIIVPKGIFLSGSLFFKPNTHLHMEEGGVLKGSDDISHFKLHTTRIEGETVTYFAALVNADKVDGFTISGQGTIDGNGLRYWKAFWLRREFNPECTNKDEMRPRLVYVSNSKNVQLSGVRLINSPFWTTHFYKCEYVKLLNLYIYSPSRPVKAPSTDAVDIDACTNFHIKNCYMSVNDDAVALKGGKGPVANQDPNNGGNSNIIIEDCTYGFCHSALTCGSESIHNRNIIFRNSTVNQAQRLFWLKMRPDTPQHYEYMLVENIKGSVSHLLDINPWTQFFDLKGHPEPFMSYTNNISMRNISMECDVLFNVKSAPDQYSLKDFTFENFVVKANKDAKLKKDYFASSKFENMIINGERIK